jgi:hypothetical protein
VPQNLQFFLTLVISTSKDFLVFPLAIINTLTPQLHPSAQRCLTRYFSGDFAS